MANGFIDIETPMLTKATPEGAPRYLVPSRTHAGKFFALPQSPQIFKQLLMMAGFDRYYQIVKCFRDEDLRAERQPEFTQLDVETSFLEQEEIMQLMEALIREVFARAANVQLPDPFPRMSFADAIRRYGSDKPDLARAARAGRRGGSRRGLRFQGVRRAAADPNGRVTALRAPGGGTLSRKEIDDYTAYVARYGAKGLAYIKVNERARGRDGLQSPIIKFLSDAAVSGILERTGAQDGDLVFFGADKAKVVSDALGALRLKLGTRSQARAGRLATAVGWWTSRCSSGTRTRSASRRCIIRSPRAHGRLRGAAGGSCRRRGQGLRHGAQRLGVRRRLSAYPSPGDAVGGVFGLLGIDAEEARVKFGFLLDALKFGCPPHGGIAFGLDRLAIADGRHGQQSATSSPSPRRRRRQTCCRMHPRKSARSSCASCTFACARHPPRRPEPAPPRAPAACPRSSYSCTVCG